MSKIRIVNWLLTRRCNLNCDYCSIVRDYENKPMLYPDMKYYIKNEMSTEVIIEALAQMKIHNPEMFHILYGGEPLLRNDLSDIINYCNKENIQYTIISNNTDEIQPLISKLINRVDYIQGFTSSVDPIPDGADLSCDRFKKSILGLNRLKDLQKSGKVRDVVAEITISNDNQTQLYDLVKELSSYGIYSDITFIDISKSQMYDFSNIRYKNSLVYPNFELSKTLNRILDNDNLLVHMKDLLIPWMFNTLPSEFDCKLEDGIHNITVDADGTMRSCLRIKGVLTPTIHVNDIFEKDCKEMDSDFYEAICSDKKKYCKKCNHSCLMMSKYIDDNNVKNSDLIHIDKRG